MRDTRLDLTERILATAAAVALGLAVAATPALAQQGTVTGQVTDASTLQPLQGVQVYVPDTELGVLTSEDGSFRITGVPAGQVRVRARLIGYRQVTRTVQVEAGATVQVDFELPVSAVSLEEVVVTATGDQARRQLGNAISTVDASDVADKRIAGSLTGLLQGQSTGVTIRENAGSVGVASTLNIRGYSSLGLDNTPIIYVDGARIDNGNNIAAGVGGQAYTQINDINPEDIESVEVVKGPAAAALYGTEAAAGVIRITTKSGTTGGPTRYSFRVEQGSNWDATDWWGMAWNPADVFGFGKDTVYTINLLDGSNEFFDTPWRTGHMQSYSGTARGGGEGVTYYISGKFDDQEGNTRSNNLRRWNGRANFNINASEDVDISVSSGFTSSRIRLPESDNNLEGYASNALGLPWNGRMVRADPNAGGEPIETCFLAFEIARAFGVPLEDANAECGSPFFAAPVEKIDQINNQRHQERFTGSVTLSYRPLDFMSNRVTIGYDESDAKLFNLTPVDPANPFGSDSDGFLFRRNSTSRNLTLDVTSTLSFDLSESFTSQTTFGGQYYRETIDATEAIGRVFPAGSPAVNNAVTNEGDDFFIESRTAGVFVEERLGWLDRLYLTGAVRLDDNAAFGENLGLQAYPSVQASWVVSEQPGFPEFFDQLRLRAAWGQSGKQPGPNDALALLNATAVTFRNQDVSGISKQQRANPDLKPETGQELEVGFDASMLDSRLGLEFTYYDQTTRDAIVERQLPPSLGFAGPEFTNIGELYNRGIEVGLDARALDRSDVTWDWRLNLTSNDNEVTELESPIVSGSQRHTVGFPFGSYFTEEVSLDSDGNAVVASEATFHGQPTPEWEGSLSSTVTLFERVTLYGLLDFAWGHQLENGFEGFSCAFLACPEIFQTNSEGELTEEARIKRAAAFGGSESPWILDADWMKLRSLSLRFDFPEAWARALQASDMSVRVAGENLALWTTYDGTDPEANWAGPDPLNRAQLWTIPPARRFLATLSMTF